MIDRRGGRCEVIAGCASLRNAVIAKLGSRQRRGTKHRCILPIITEGSCAVIFRNKQIGLEPITGNSGVH